MKKCCDFASVLIVRERSRRQRLTLLRLLGSCGSEILRRTQVANDISCEAPKAGEHVITVGMAQGDRASATPATIDQVPYQSGHVSQRRNSLLRGDVMLKESKSSRPICAYPT